MEEGTALLRSFALGEFFPSSSLSLLLSGGEFFLPSS